MLLKNSSEIPTLRSPLEKDGISFRYLLRSTTDLADTLTGALFFAGNVIRALTERLTRAYVLLCVLQSLLEISMILTMHNRSLVDLCLQKG